MKIIILKHIGNIGVIVDWKPFLRDRLEIEIGEEGTLIVGARTYRVEDGSAIVEEYNLKQGGNKVYFRDNDRTLYECGELKRNGRFIEAVNQIDEVVAKLAIGYEQLAVEVAELREEIAEKERERAIKVV